MPDFVLPVDLASRVKQPESLLDVWSNLTAIRDQINLIKNNPGVGKTLRRTLWLPVMDEVAPAAGGYGAIPRLPIEVAPGQVQHLVRARIKLSEGTINYTVKIDGANVNGLTAKDVTGTTENVHAAGAPPLLSTGNYVELVINSATAAKTLAFGLVVEDVF